MDRSCDEMSEIELVRMRLGTELLDHYQILPKGNHKPTKGEEREKRACERCEYVISWAVGGIGRGRGRKRAAVPPSSQ